jgi:hypothetical protein
MCFRYLKSGFAGALLLSSAACSRSRTYTTSDGKVSVEQKGKDASRITVAGKDGNTSTLSFNENKVPDDYPKDIPVYSPAKVIMAQSASDQNARNLVLESQDPSDSIVAFYKKGLESNGWSTENTLTTPQMTMLTAKKDKRQVVLQISDDHSKRSIMQTAADKK